jgi:hypothetical protein
MADPTGLYSYGAPVVVTGNTGGANVNTGVAVAPTGSSPHTPPANTATVVYPGGSPTTEIATTYTPTLASVSPTTAVHGSGADLTLTCTGTKFVTGGSSILFNGAARPTTFVSATSLTCPVQPSTFASAGAVSVVVANGGLLSGPQTFTFT